MADPFPASLQAARADSAKWLKAAHISAIKRSPADPKTLKTSADSSRPKTIVPVRLSQSGDEHLVSRSQAKRLLARVEKFKTVVLDFEGVSEIGHSYADEIFRVFANANPAIELLAINTNDEVRAMINRARRTAAETK